jgi:hypothetical protein
MKLWVDDVRPMPKGFDYHAKTAQEAIHLIGQNIVEEISLDHDLGSEEPRETGYFVAKFIMVAAHNKWIKPIRWAVHSANPVGRENIENALRNADLFWAGDGK